MAETTKVAKADPVALAKNSIYAALTNEKTIQALRDSLPDSGITPQRVASIAFTVIARSPSLLACTTQSLIRALIETSLLGLSLDPHLKQAALVPFKNKDKHEVTLIIEYMGLVKLARNSGVLQDIDAKIVYEKDDFDYYEGLEPKLYHKPARGDRGKPVGVYAVAILQNGLRKFRFLEELEVNFYRQKSRAADSADSPWTTDPMSMWRKTAIRRLCGYLAMDDRTQRALHDDEMAETGQPQVLAAEFFDVINVEPERKPTKTEEKKSELKERRAGSGNVAGFAQPDGPETHVEETRSEDGGGAGTSSETPLEEEDAAARKAQWDITYNALISHFRSESEAEVAISEATLGKVQTMKALREAATIDQLKLVAEHVSKLQKES